MKKFSQQWRDSIAAEVRELMVANYRGPNLRAACQYWAEAGETVLKRHGVRALVQAGSAVWPRLAPEEMGQDNDAWGYTFEPDDPRVESMIFANQMPEMHVWLAIPDRMELIDFSVSYQPEQAKELMDLEWRAAPPPSYLWADHDELVRLQYLYIPSVEATTLALMLRVCCPLIGTPKQVPYGFLLSRWRKALLECSDMFEVKGQ